MHESWPLKLLPASRQTLYWTQTTPREKRITVHFFSPQHTNTQRHRHTHITSSALFCKCFFFLFHVQMSWFDSLFLVLSHQKESITFISPPVEEGLRPVSRPGIGIWQQHLLFCEHFWRHSGCFFFLCLFFRFFYIYIFIVVVVVLDFLLEQQVRVRSVVFFSSEWLDDGYFTRNCASDGAPSAGPELPKNRLPPGR